MVEYGFKPMPHSSSIHVITHQYALLSSQFHDKVILSASFLYDFSKVLWFIDNFEKHIRRAWNPADWLFTDN